MGELLELFGQLGQLQEILTGVINGDNTMISSEGSLAGSDGAGDVGGSLVGSAIGSLGLEDLIDEIPTDTISLIGSVADR